MSQVHSRIAPTPSGFLHQGNAYNFLLTHQLNRQHGGILRLRIDDLDAPRVRPEYLADIFETLDWLRISWDEGPRTVAEQTATYSQQLRQTAYNSALTRLITTGQVFACNCSRKEVLDNSKDGQYSGTCISKKIPLNTPDVAWRVLTGSEAIIGFKDEISGLQEVNLHQANRHFVVRRRDGLPAYQIASLVDDMAYGCNLIVRGTDLLESTAAQLYLAQLLGYRQFSEARFYHHPILQDTHGEKLSKSAGSTSIKHLRAAGKPFDAFRDEFNTWVDGFYERLNRR